jgi:CDGSH-type Zn-finger protein
MSEVTIVVANNGPYRIATAADIVLKDADGNVFDLSGRPSVSLCRCGQSNNKPFCDGTHNRCGFQSEIKAP